ncbi:hypothetical protein SFSGTM_21820 [Sulfuriferula nivalis]|uniref:Uncharacterized protein n=1 Tax=Sulfuriferula nivalis TaxID=2675298 RepID=A0A809RKZ0_9PROT|nr:hypothetical protein SFSGTM_21820 [Sulfuriferula nivalis]
MNAPSSPDQDEYIAQYIIVEEKYIERLVVVLTFFNLENTSMYASVGRTSGHVQHIETTSRMQS